MHCEAAFKAYHREVICAQEGFRGDYGQTQSQANIGTKRFI